MAIRVRTCAECAGQFQYEIGRGKDGLYCSKACRNVARLKNRDAWCKDRTCELDGCSNRPRDVGSSICEMHYGRLRRNGTLERLELKVEPKRQHSHGYVMVYTPNHPMTTEGYRARPYEHRAVYFDAHGAGPFNCHVCGKQGMLADFHVDHLNEDRADNRLDNLAPACPPCNQWRTTSRVDACRKKRTTRLLKFNGEELAQSEWARRLGVAPQSIHFRLKAGWPVERALTEPRGVTGPKRKAA